MAVDGALDDLGPPAPGARHRAPRGLPPEAQRVLAVEVQAGRRRHLLVGRDPGDGHRGRHSRGVAPSPCTKASRSIASRRCRPPTSARSSGCRQARRSSATSRALVAHKGQRYLVDAAPAVVRALPDTHVLIFGEGELRPALPRQIKHLGLEHHVRLVGFRPDVLSLLKGLDVFVMSSITEGLGTSILDAMAASKAVVGTTAGGIPEAVEHGVTGLLVPPHHADALADAILSAAQGRAAPAPDGRGRTRARARAVHRRSDGRRDAGRLRARGRQTPRSGQRESPAGVLKPHRPSASRGGTARSRSARDPRDRVCRSDAVMDAAMRQPGERVARQARGTGRRGSRARRAAR